MLHATSTVCPKCSGGRNDFRAARHTCTRCRAWDYYRQRREMLYKTGSDTASTVWWPFHPTTARMTVVVPS